MKKRLALLLALIMVCATVLTACGSSSKVVGTWILSGAEVGEVKASDDDLKAFGDFTMKFSSNGSVTVSNGGSDEVGKWKEDGDTITISNSTTTEIKLELKDGELTTEQGGATLIFKKK